MSKCNNIIKGSVAMNLKQLCQSLGETFVPFTYHNTTISIFPLLAITFLMRKLSIKFCFMRFFVLVKVIIYSSLSSLVISCIISQTLMNFNFSFNPVSNRNGLSAVFQEKYAEVFGWYEKDLEGIEKQYESGKVCHFLAWYSSSSVYD